MHVVAVINYKGGVGKTTITANLGAELAVRGQNVLMVDCDPQASLTFSFYRPEDWKQDLAGNKTLREWYTSFLNGDGSVRLEDLITTPDRANKFLKNGGGRLDLIASHLLLTSVDLALATHLGGAGPTQSSARYVRTLRRLADGLREPAFADYDFVLIDCPPNFNIVTRSAMVASDHILIPAKPDYLSTLGVKYLREQLIELTDEYNNGIQVGQLTGIHPIEPKFVGVVLNMYQTYRQEATRELRHDINAMLRDIGDDLYVFKARVRESKSLFSRAAREGVPAVLNTGSRPEQVQVLVDLTTEFLNRIGVNLGVAS